MGKLPNLINVFLFHPHYHPKAKKYKESFNTTIRLLLFTSAPSLQRSPLPTITATFSTMASFGLTIVAIFAALCHSSPIAR
jgi:hypothetical protein